MALALFLALMLTLILGDADLWLIIAANGAIPLFSGVLCLLAVRRLRLPYRFRRARGDPRARARACSRQPGYLLVIESATALIYGVIRPIVGLFKSAATVGLLEGPIRAHNLFYAYYGALGVTTLPTATAYSARDDRAPPAAARAARLALHPRAGGARCAWRSCACPTWCSRPGWATASARAGPPWR